MNKINYNLIKFNFDQYNQDLWDVYKFNGQFKPVKYITKQGQALKWMMADGSEDWGWEECAQMTLWMMIKQRPKGFKKLIEQLKDWAILQEVKRRGPLTVLWHMIISAGHKSSLRGPFFEDYEEGRIRRLILRAGLC